MFEKLESCPSCGHPKFINHLICTDHSVSGDSFALVKCDKCELIFTNPRPDTEQLPKFYQSEDYISHSNKATNLVNWVYKLVRSITLKRKVRLINELHTTGKLLDFGCGTGHFINAAKQNGWEVNGVEPDPSARSQAQKSTSIDIQENLDSVKGEFDIITAWHVVEHVPDLLPTIKQLSKLLSDKGHLIIAVPNCASFDSKNFGVYWAGYDVPRHLYHFTQKSFLNLATKCKLTLIQTLPMKFDSFYVSMLSEKYMNGKSNYLRSFKVGKQSNRLARKTSEYSSLIYILKK